MKTIYLSTGKFKYDNVSELSLEFKKCNISLGDGCRLGDRCKLGDGCELGDGCRLGDTPFYALGLYKYHVCTYWNENIGIIQLGCCVRTVEEWEADFWNNPSEFTDPDAPDARG